MFKVSKKNEKLVSNIMPIQKDKKFLINSSDKTNQKFSSLKNYVNQANSCSNKIEETSFIISKTTTKEKENKNDFLKKKIKFEIYNTNESSNQSKKMFLTKKITKDGGRWNKNEKLKFLECFYKFGFDWKKINKNISSRTGKQVRSHAQKFLLGLRKFKDDSLGIDFTTNIYKDREKLLYKIREIINNSEKENIFIILTNKLSKKNLLNDIRSHKDDSHNLNDYHINIHNNDFSEINEEKSEIDIEKNINKIFDNNILEHKSNLNLNCNISVFDNNIGHIPFVNNSIEYYYGSIDKSYVGFNDNVNKVNYNNEDLLMNEKYFNENEFLQNIDRKNITYVEEINKKYIINKKEAIIEYQFGY